MSILLHGDIYGGVDQKVQQGTCHEDGRLLARVNRTVHAEEQPFPAAQLSLRLTACDGNRLLAV